MDQATNCKTTRKPVRPWTDDEDEQLLAAVGQQVYNKTIDWKLVASFIPNRTNKDCRKRWVYSSAPWINKGPWTDSEDALLVEAVNQHGTRWSSVCATVSTRQADQCARRWYEVLNPSISRDRWTLYEDQMLRNAVRAHGRSWTEISERYFPNRTPIKVRNRFHQLHRIDSASPQASSSES